METTPLERHKFHQVPEIEEPLGPQWYAVYTRSHHESIIEKGLNYKGLETFLPRVTISSKRKDRRLLLEVPLFPGYLFVHADLLTTVYYQIIKQPGVVSILGSHGKFTPIPVETITSIQKVLQSGVPYSYYPKLERGMRVKVIDGPLEGTCGVILRKKQGKKRLLVSVELLGRGIVIDLSEEIVEPL